MKRKPNSWQSLNKKSSSLALPSGMDQVHNEFLKLNDKPDEKKVTSRWRSSRRLWIIFILGWSKMVNQSLTLVVQPASSSHLAVTHAVAPVSLLQRSPNMVQPSLSISAKSNQACTSLFGARYCWPYWWHSTRSPTNSQLQKIKVQTMWMEPVFSLSSVTGLCRHLWVDMHLAPLSSSKQTSPISTH